MAIGNGKASGQRSDQCGCALGTLGVESPLPIPLFTYNVRYSFGIYPLYSSESKELPGLYI